MATSSQTIATDRTRLCARSGKPFSEIRDLSWINDVTMFEDANSEEDEPPFVLVANLATDEWLKGELNIA